MALLLSSSFISEAEATESTKKTAEKTAKKPQVSSTKATSGTDKTLIERNIKFLEDKGYQVIKAGVGVVPAVVGTGVKVVGTGVKAVGTGVKKGAILAEKGYDKFIDKKFAISPNIGTKGVGIEASYKINDYLALRGGPNYLSFNDKSTISALRYGYNLDFSDVGALVDVHPLKNAFRVTAGGFYGKSKVDFNATASSPVQVGNNFYTASQVGTIRGKVQGENFTPYLGVGYTRKWMTDENFYFDADLGVEFDNVKTTLTSDGTASGNAAFQADLERERQKIGNFFDFMQYYPVARMAVSYKF